MAYLKAMANTYGAMGVHTKEISSKAREVGMVVGNQINKEMRAIKVIILLIKSKAMACIYGITAGHTEETSKTI